MRLLLSFLFLLSSLVGSSQNFIAEEINSQYQASNFSYTLFEPTNSYRFKPDFLPENAKYAELILKNDQLNSIIQSTPNQLEVIIPYGNNSLTLLLLQNNNQTNFEVFAKSKSGKRKVNIEHDNIHYYGVVKEFDQSLVSFTIINGELRIVIGIEGENINIGKIKNRNSYAFVPTANSTLTRGGCDTDLLPKSNRKVSTNHTSAQNALPDGCIDIYFELDYQTYLDNGSSVANTVAYFQGLFNEVSTLYLNEQINVQISELLVWEEQDPYPHGGTSITTLYEFADKIEQEDYNGDLAHLISSVQSFRGGVAYLDVLCSPVREWTTGFSEITGSYNNVPTYSYDVEVVTHELGHNLGSPHTHACEWNGNNTQIDDCGNEASPAGADDCYDASNPILPQNGGTIMSYCHLINGVGINFSNGFGQQPGDLIRNRVSNADCAESCCQFDAEADLGNDIETCAETIVLDAGLSGYDYEWSTGETTQTIEVTESGDYSVVISNNCGNDEDEITVEFLSEPIVDLPTEFQYCDSPVTIDATNTEATAYEWSTGETTPTVQLNSVGNYWVEVTNSCATTRHEFEVVQITAVSISLGDDREICEDQSIQLTIPTNGTSYLWSTGETTQSITVTNAGEYWGEVISNCGSDRDTVAITSLPLPLVNVSGVLAICEGENTTLTANVEYADNFEWSTGETTETIVISDAGDYFLQAENNCGESSFPFTISVEQQPVVNLGPDTNLCAGESLTLSLPDGANSYAWNTGETTQSITVSNAGTYTGEIITNCGTANDTIEIEAIIEPTINLMGSTQICEGGQTELSVNQEFGSEVIWSTGETTNSIMIDEVGEYWVQVNNVCFSVQEDFLITFQEDIDVNIDDEYLLCAGEELLLDATYPNASYQWQDGSVEPTFTVSEEGNYSVIVSANGCVEQVTTQVNVIEPISVNLGRDTTICLRNELELYVPVEDGQSVLWNDSSTSSLFVASETGTYSVQLSNICETVADQIYVEFYDCCIAQLPTGFSPNNDGKNDHFYPLFTCNISEYSFQIFNRKGNKVFESKTSQHAWDGQFEGVPAATGAYIWSLSYFDEENNETRTYEGVVNLIR